MTITRIQANSSNADGTSSISQAFGSNITAGNRIVIFVTRYAITGDASIELADISKSAGSATLGSFTLDANAHNTTTGSEAMNVAIFSAPVTGTGSCTIQVVGDAINDYWNITVAEYHSDSGSITVEDNATANGETGAASSGDGTSAGGAVFCGGSSYYVSTSVTITHDTAFTLIYEEEDGSIHNVCSFIERIVTSGTTDAAEWTAPTTVQWVAVLAVYAEPSGGSLAINKSENVSVADTLTINLSDALQVSASENINTTENVIASLPSGVLEINVTDSISVGEIISLKTTLSISVSDDAFVIEGEFFGGIANFEVSTSESITTAEIATLNVTPHPTLEVNKTDSIGISESVELSVGTAGEQNINVSENIGVAESASAAIQPVPDLSASVSENITVSENAAASIESIADREINVLETIGLAENVALAVIGAGELAISVSENIGAAENMTVSVTPHPTLEISPSESITVAENTAAAVQAMPDLSLSVSETILLAESCSPATDALQISPSELISAAELVTLTILASGTLGLAVSETLSLTEYVELTVGSPEERTVIQKAFKRRNRYMTFRLRYRS